MAVNDKTFNLKEVMGVVTAAQRRPDNRLQLKIKGLVLSIQEYQKQDKTKGYKVLMFVQDQKAVLTFTTSRVVEEGKVFEALVTLTGFTAFEPTR